MQKGCDSVHTGAAGIPQYHTVMCQLHSVWHHLLQVIAMRCTDRLCRRSSLWEFSLRHVKATKQHISCITISALRHLCQATSRNVDDLVRYRFTKNQTSAVSSMSKIRINNGLKCSKRRQAIATPFCYLTLSSCHMIHIRLNSPGSSSSMFGLKGCSQAWWACSAEMLGLLGLCGALWGVLSHWTLTLSLTFEYLMLKQICSPVHTPKRMWYSHHLRPPRYFYATGNFFPKTL